MPSDNTNSDQPTAQKPNSQSLFDDFWKSAVNAAVEQPITAVGQMFNPNFSFDPIKPGATKTGSLDYYVEGVGSAVGLVGDMLALRYGLKSVAKTSVGAGLAPVVENRFGLAAVSGGIYGGVFTPVNPENGNQLVSRLENAGITAGTFAALEGLGGKLASARPTSSLAGAIEKFSASPDDVAGRLSSGLSQFASSRLGTIAERIGLSAAAGVPIGMLNTQAQSLIVDAKHRPAGLAQTLQSGLDWGVIGGALAAPAAIKGVEAPAPSAKSDVVAPAPASDGTVPPMNPDAVAPWVKQGGDAPSAESHVAAPAAESRVSAPSAESQVVAPAAESHVNAPLAESRVLAPSAESGNRAPSAEAVQSGPPDTIKARYGKPKEVPLTDEEKALWHQIGSVDTVDKWRTASDAVDEQRLETQTYFEELLANQAPKLSESDLNQLWPELITNSQSFQGTRVSKLIADSDPALMERLWNKQLDAVKASGDRDVAEALGQRIMHLTPDRQLPALNSLLDLDTTPVSARFASTYVARENQIPAAQMLLDRGSEPMLNPRSGSFGAYADWVFSHEPGATRQGLLAQLRQGMKSGGQPADLSGIYRVAAERATPADMHELRMMWNATGDGPVGRDYRQTVATDADPRFLGHLFFYDEHWAASDQLAQTNPDLLRELASSSRPNGSIPRSEALANLTVGDKPFTAAQIVESLTTLADQTGANKIFPLTDYDVNALARYSVKPEPQELVQLLGKLHDNALSALGIGDGAADESFNQFRLKLALNLAHGISGGEEEAAKTYFTEPVETALADPGVSYEKRLSSALTLAALQRQGFEPARLIGIPELRMPKLSELSPEQATELRSQVESALYDPDQLRAMLGSGPLGRAMPRIFGDTTDGGIVGRVQHSGHDLTLDGHLLDVVGKVGQDPEFQSLPEKDQVNLLWTALLHDIGKRENTVDLDHELSSAGIAWGVLRTLGYPEARIQRIADLLSGESDLSFNPNVPNSQMLEDQNKLDDIVASYRHPDSLKMVTMLNTADIKSVKADGSWYTPAVASELSRIQDMGQNRVEYLNRHLLPILTSQMPAGYGVHEMSDYNVLAHSSNNLPTFLSQLSTAESPEFTMSASLLTPDHQELYTGLRPSDNKGLVAIVSGPFEHISQAYRGNLSTGYSVTWDGHVNLVRNWAGDTFRADKFTQEAEDRLGALNIPADPQTSESNYPRLAQSRRVLSQYDSLDEMRAQRGEDDPYVQAAFVVNRMMTTSRDGSPMQNHNEVKLNNPIVSGIGVLHQPGQQVFFEDMPADALQNIWSGSVPSWAQTGPAGTAGDGAVVVPSQVWRSAQQHDLPLVVLNSAK